MTKQTEALRMAIEWLDNQQIGYSGHSVRKACQEALAETQEPVAYQPTSQEQSVMHQAMIRSSKLVHKATPPSREWVGLSDKEIESMGEEYSVYISKHLARAIDAKLREKNR